MDSSYPALNSSLCVTVQYLKLHTQVKLSKLHTCYGGILYIFATILFKQHNTNLY